jgi:hypothetical protein
VIGEEGPLCDRCADEAIAIRTGWPQLKGPPPPGLFRGPDGIEHRMVYRILRTPGGIEVLAEEDGWAVEDGYRLALLGPHDADVVAMWEQLRRMVQSAIGRQYLERSPHRDGWVLRGKEVEGRLVWRDDRLDDPELWSTSLMLIQVRSRVELPPVRLRCLLSAQGASRLGSVVTASLVALGFIDAPMWAARPSDGARFT